MKTKHKNFYFDANYGQWSTFSYRSTQTSLKWYYLQIKYQLFHKLLCWNVLYQYSTNYEILSFKALPHFLTWNIFFFHHFQVSRRDEKDNFMPDEIKHRTRMHSSRMRTGRTLTVFRRLLFRGEGVWSWGGGFLPGPGGCLVRYPLPPGPGRYLPPTLTESQTGVKTLPWPKLRFGR